MGGKFRISIRAFDPVVERAYVTLFPADPQKSAELLNWRMRANPHGPARFVIAERGDDIAGMIALVPTRLRNLPGNPLAYQAIDTAVHPSCRGQGLFVELGAFAQSPSGLGAQLLWGFPNANAAPGWFRRLGWTNFGAVPLLLKPLRSSLAFKQLHAGLGIIDFPLVRARKSLGQPYEDGFAFASDVDQLWRKIAGDFGIAVDRSGDWMRWRVQQKPEANYRSVGIKTATGELDAFAVTQLADKHGARLLYVMEAMSAKGRERELGELLLSEVSRAAGQGAEAALAWCPRNAPNYSSYRKAGFMPLPPRLRPIEINFGARSYGADSAAATADRWYVSFLDSDTN